MARGISEHDATLAVDAAARKEYEKAVARHAALGERVAPWDAATPQAKLAWRNEVLDVVWARSSAPCPTTATRLGSRATSPPTTAATPT